jgi:hypothetical protein
MPDDFPDLRKLLDAVPAADPRPVDLAALYRAAADRQAGSARRWKRVALAAAALAAGVLLVALLPRLEFRASDHEFAVRWGTPPEPPPPAPPPEPKPDPRIEELLEEQSRQLVAIRATNGKHAELQDLLLTLAADVSDRDKAQQAKIAALTKKLTAFEADTARQFADAEKTNTALYDAVFSTPKAKGTQ